MKKVWVCTTGKYSDYRIRAIFRKKETAELWLASIHEYHHPAIEKYAVDDLAKIEGKRYEYSIEGTKIEVFETNEQEFDPLVEPNGRIWGILFARDEKHAHKKVVELFQAELRKRGYREYTTASNQGNA